MNNAVARLVALSAGLLLCAAPMGTASAADGPECVDRGSVSTVEDLSDRPQQPGLTALTSARTVDARQEFRVRGSAASLPAGTRVTLQHWQQEGWTSLPAEVRTTSDGTYNMRVKLWRKGPNTLRIVAACLASEPFQVTVR